MISKEYILDINNWEIVDCEWRGYVICLKKEKESKMYLGYVITTGKLEIRSYKKDKFEIPTEYKTDFSNKHEYYFSKKEEAELTLKSFLEKIKPKVFKKEDLKLI